MDSASYQPYLPSEHVDGVVKKIAELLQPVQIYLYNQKFCASGETAAFKLCVVASIPNTQAAQRDIYLQVDSDVPYDVLVYTPEEWEALTGNPDSFAHRIRRNGMVLYG